MKIHKIGFEFEILVRQKDFLKVWDNIYKISKHIKLGGDTSVKGGNGWRDLEIKTEAISEKRALSLFNRVLEYLVELNGEGIIKTNNTCGLHVNISTENNVYTYFQVIEKYDDKKYLRLWNRENNPACPPLKFRENKTKYDNDPYEYLSVHRGEKYHSVAIRDGDQTNGVRLENRIIGGKDYILRYNDLDKTISDFITLVESAKPYEN